MPLERRVTVDRSLATSEQENPSRSNAIPRSGRRYDEPQTNAPSSRTGSCPAQRDPQRPRTTASQSARYTGDAQLRLPADADSREYYDYGAKTERFADPTAATDQLTLLPLNRQLPRARTTSAYPTSTSQQTRPSGKQAVSPSMQRRTQEPVTRPAPRQRYNPLTQIGRMLSPLRRKSRRMWQRQPLLTQIGVIACSLFLAMELGLNGATWFISTWSDPLTYFHHDTAVVTINGHREQVRAFMGESGQVDLLVVPEDVSKSKILPGAQTRGMDPSQVMFQVNAHGSLVEVEALAPREMVWHLFAKQDTLPCVFDLAGQKGGK